MSDRTPALIEITREAPCDDRRDELLSLLAFRDEAGNGGATRRHTQSCRRCRAFLDSVALEMRLSTDSLSEIAEREGTRPPHRSVRGAADPPRSAAEELPFSKPFDRWLERQLRERTELDLAKSMTRAARWLLLIDPDVSGRLAAPASDPDSGDASLEVGHRLMIELRDIDAAIHRGTASKRVRRRTGADRRHDIVQKLHAEFDARLSSTLHRRALARSLVSRAQEISRGRHGAAWLTEALLAWFWGNGSSVVPLLTKAGTHENSPDTAASILLNLALISCEKSLGGRAFDLLARALQCRPGPALERVIRVNRAIWNHACFHPEAAARDLTVARRLGSMTSLRGQFSVLTIESVVANLALMHDLPKARQHSTLRKTLEAIHGE